MEQNAAKQPLSIFGLIGAAAGAGIGFAIWKFAIEKPGDHSMQFAMSIVFGIVGGALAGNRLGKLIRGNQPPSF
jgi:hypothetical protein